MAAGLVDGTVLVLMNWPDDTHRRYDGTDVKNVFYVVEALQRP